jgi:site-specific recombinase XerC
MPPTGLEIVNTPESTFSTVSSSSYACLNHQRWDRPDIECLLNDGLAKPTVKQHLAAIRMLFDWMVTGGLLPFNPAASVRGPKYVIKKGKTPVLTPDEARLLPDSIDIQELSGLRDRALIGVMVYSFGRVSAVVGMNVDDYYQRGKR